MADIQNATIPAFGARQRPSITLHTFDDDVEPVPDDPNAFTIEWIAMETRHNITGRNLWNDFGTDFEGWTLETFKLLDNDNRRDLRTYLEEGGIVMDSSLKRINHQLLAVIAETDWSQQLSRQQNQTPASPEALDQLSTAREHSTHYSAAHVPSAQPPTNFQENNATSAPRQPSYVTFSSDRKTPKQERDDDKKSTERNFRGTQFTPLTPDNDELYRDDGPFLRPQPQPGQRSRSAGSAQPFMAPNQRTYYPTSHEFSEQRIQIDTPPDENPSQTSFTRSLTTLMKIYSDKEKYHGAADILDIKLYAFTDLCLKSGVPESAYALAFSAMLSDEALQFYYLRLAGKSLSFDTMLDQVRTNFETEERRRRAFNWWHSVSLSRIKKKHPSKSLLECFEAMRTHLINTQFRLRQNLWNDEVLRDRMLLAVQYVPECAMVVYKPSPTFHSVCEDIRNAVGITSAETPHTDVFLTKEGEDDPIYVDDPSIFGDDEVMMTDRRFMGNRTRQDALRNRDVPKTSSQQPTRSYPGDLVCNVCNKIGCISYNHPVAERREARLRVQKARGWDENKAQQFLSQLEGSMEQFILDQQIDHEPSALDEKSDSNHWTIVHDSFVTDHFGPISSSGAENMLDTLNQQSLVHAMTRVMPADPTDVTFLTSRYNSDVFMGILIDTGAANKSTAGEAQFRALQRHQKVKLIPHSGTVTFGIGQSNILGIAGVSTPLGTIQFYVVAAQVPFLLSLQDLTNAGAIFDNLNNYLIQGKKRIPTVLAYGHAWVLLGKQSNPLVVSNQQEILPDYTITCHLTEMELRRLHRRFGHPSAGRLYKILDRAGHEPRYALIERLTRFCHDCQKNGKSPGRFKFTLKDDHDFNHTIIIDIVQIDGKNALHVVDEATSYNACHWLKSLSAKDVYSALRICWDLVLIGPAMFIVHDPGRSFRGTFKEEAAENGSTVREMPVEAHNSVGKVERYHTPLRRVYELFLKTLPKMSKEERLQMAVKCVNDTAGPDGLVPTLLVFGAYPRVLTSEGPPATIAARAQAIKKGMEEVRKCHAVRKVREALRMRNGPTTSHLANLQVGSEVLVWREKTNKHSKGWKGPFTLVGMTSETCHILIKNTITDFRSTSVRPYSEDPNAPLANDKDSLDKEVLASELYAMVAGIDMAISVSTTLNLIMEQLNLKPIPVVICTDSFSLYECMVKLGTTKEKRLMIDIMAIRQAYERRELSEIRWISGISNPADAMTKTRTKVNSALQTLVSANELEVRVEGWVERPDVEV